jgi:hypothetical protein
MPILEQAGVEVPGPPLRRLDKMLRVPNMYGTEALVTEVIALIRGEGFSRMANKRYLAALRRARGRCVGPAGLPFPLEPVERAIRHINLLYPATD